MNQKHKNGIISEYLAAAWFTNNGFTVSWPSDCFGEYDFIIDDKVNSPKRVQVKTIFFDNGKGRYIGNTVLSHRLSNGHTINKKYSDNSFDLCAFVCRDYNAIYILPIELVKNRRCITFYPDGSEPNYRCKCNYESYKETLITIYE